MSGWTCKVLHAEVGIGQTQVKQTSDGEGSLWAILVTKQRTYHRHYDETSKPCLER